MSRAGAEAAARRARLQLVAAGTRLAAAGLILPGEGNISCRLDERWMLVTPRGADKGRLAALDLIPVSLGADDPPAAASSETLLHAAVYRLRDDVGAVVHAHPPGVLALVAHGRVPDCELLEEAAHVLPDVALIGYRPTGSVTLADAAAAALATGFGVVLERHGAVTVAGDLEGAVRRMLLLERLAVLTLRAG